MARRSPRKPNTARRRPLFIIKDDVWTSLVVGLLLLAFTLFCALPTDDQRAPDPLPPAALTIVPSHG